MLGEYCFTISKVFKRKFHIEIHCISIQLKLLNWSPSVLSSCTHEGLFINCVHTLNYNIISYEMAQRHFQSFRQPDRKRNIFKEHRFDLWMGINITITVSVLNERPVCLCTPNAMFRLNGTVVALEYLGKWNQILFEQHFNWIIQN